MELGRTVHPSNEMKQIILSIYLLILFLKVEAKYAAYSIEHMVLTCDTFLIGQIVTHDAETFTIALDDSSGHVRIQKFKNWTCAHRYAEYEIGQKALFFLEKRDRKFYVMSGGNEGELPIVGDSLYLSSLSVYYPFDLDVGQELTGSKTTLISGKRFHGYDFRTRHFVETIRTFRGHFSFTLDEYSRLKSIEAKDLDLSERLAQQDELYKLFFRRIRYLMEI